MVVGAAVGTISSSTISVVSGVKAAPFKQEMWDENSSVVIPENWLSPAVLVWSFLAFQLRIQR